MKRIWLMGKVRELDPNDTKPFEDGVNNDLAFYNGKDSKRVFSAFAKSQNMIYFVWWTSVIDELDNPDNIPLDLWMLITGECDNIQPAWEYRMTVIRNIKYVKGKDLCNH